MENNFLLTDDMLWDYADGFLSAAQKEEVDAYIQQHPEWQTRLNNILAEKQELSSLKLETPNPGFADRVMAAWATEQVKPKAKPGGKDWIIRLIAVGFVLFILSPLVIMVFAALQLSPTELPKIEVPALPVINWSIFTDSLILQYGLLLTFTVIGLRFLDKLLQKLARPHQLA